MSALEVFLTIAGYFLVLIIISWLTAGKADSKAFFTANKQSPWYLVAFGMIGTSLSGVTFISIPGEVGAKQFAYFQIVLGYMVGYFIIATVLMPLYYRLNLVSIYQYLAQRFGQVAYKTGAAYFLLSRVIGASFRLYLVAGVLQQAFFNQFNIPFGVTVLITIVLIWLYTFRGGMKTIVYTDTLQTLFMLLAVVVTVIAIGNSLGLPLSGLVGAVQDSNYAQVFFWDGSGQNFFKQFFAGAGIALVMTGLDQDMMQKNLTCRNLKEAQKNVFWFSTTLIVVNLLFLGLGALLYMYATQNGIAIPERTDQLYPLLAIEHFPKIVGIFFLIGIVAAAYSSADSALTALTTSFCVDILGPGTNGQAQSTTTRKVVHLSFSLLLFFVILAFNAVSDDSVISSLFTIAGYTYGPLLGLYAFGLFTNRVVADRFVWAICLASPLLSYFLNSYSEVLLFGYKLGFELLIINGVFTFLGLLLISHKATEAEAQRVSAQLKA